MGRSMSNSVLTIVERSRCRWRLDLRLFLLYRRSDKRKSGRRSHWFSAGGHLGASIVVSSPAHLNLAFNTAFCAPELDLRSTRCLPAMSILSIFLLLNNFQPTPGWLRQ